MQGEPDNEVIEGSRAKDGLLGYREQFEALFSNLPMGISFLTPDMRHIRLNPFLETRLGIRSEDVAGRFCYDTIGMYKDDPARKGEERVCDMCGVVTALRTGKPSVFTRFVKDGLIKENLAVPIKDKDGQISGAVLIINDITGQVENIRKHATGPGAVPPENDEKGEKEEFLAMFTHDLKSPLTSIIGYCELILNGYAGEVGKEMRGPMQGIHANAQRMMGLVRDFLSAGHLGENAFMAEPEPVEVESLVIDSLKNMEPQIKDKGLFTELWLEPGLPSVLADRHQMERVLCNLIANSVKFTPCAGKITLRAYKADGHVNIEVSDTGVGIPEDELPMLFEKYYQGRGSSRLMGNGLGLYIAKCIVLAHRGEVKVSSRAGEGATFTVSLPRG